MLTLMYSPDECASLAEAIRRQQSRVQAMAATIGTLRSGLDSRIAARNSIGTRLNTLQSNIKKQSDLLTKYDLALKTYINDKAANESKHAKGGNNIEYLMKEAMRSFEQFKGSGIGGMKIYLPTLSMFAAADKFKSLLGLFGKTSGAGTLVGVVGLPKLFGITRMPSLPYPRMIDFVDPSKYTDATITGWVGGGMKNPLNSKLESLLSIARKSSGFSASVAALSSGAGLFATYFSTNWMPTGENKSSSAMSDQQKADEMARIFAGVAGNAGSTTMNAFKSTAGVAAKKSGGLLSSLGRGVGSLGKDIGKGLMSIGSSGYDTAKSGVQWFGKKAVGVTIGVTNTTIGSFNKLKAVYNSDVGEYFRELGGNCLTTLGSGVTFLEKTAKGDLPGAWAEAKLFGNGITSVLYTSASGVVYGIGKAVELTGNTDAAKWFYDYADENRGIDGVGAAFRHEGGGDPAMEWIAEASDGLTYAAKAYKTITGLPKLAEKGADATEKLFKGEFGEAFKTVTGWKTPSFSDDYAIKLSGDQYLERAKYISDFGSNIKKAEKYTSALVDDGLLGLTETVFEGVIVYKELSELDGYLKNYQQFSGAFAEYRRDQRALPR